MFDQTASLTNEYSTFNDFSGQTSTATNEKQIKSGAPNLIADKTRIPAIEAAARPRLIEQIEKSLDQFGATLVAGRTGTGKTAVCAAAARRRAPRAAWFKIEAADADWTIFSSYLFSCLRQFSDLSVREAVATRSPLQNRVATASRSDLPPEIAPVVAEFVQQFAAAAESAPALIVLDDAHTIFDAPWFAEFFQILLPLRATGAQLLISARTLPPLPLWRMRSKQMLGVIDEQSLAFTSAETARLFYCHGIPAELAAEAQKHHFGRAAKLQHLVEMFDKR